jgi:broad specificity phosphatase PhoE
MTTQLLLVRHGESTWNSEGRIQGQADPPPSHTGELQAEALAQRLRRTALEAVVCSPALRAHHTARAIGNPHSIGPFDDARLLEVNLGTWQGRRVSDLSDEESAHYRAWEIDPISVSPPGGETLDSALARVAPAMECLLRDHAGGTIVVVTHSITGRVALSHLLGAGVTLAPRLLMKKGSITKLRLEHGHAVLERLSDTAHLRSL